jgi:hypothetical protein
LKSRNRQKWLPIIATELLANSEPFLYLSMVEIRCSIAPFLPGKLIEHRNKGMPTLCYRGLERLNQCGTSRYFPGLLNAVVS